MRADRTFNYVPYPVIPGLTLVVHAQMIENTEATNNLQAGIHKSLADEISTGWGSINMTRRASKWERP